MAGQLETAATAGVAVVLAIIGIVMYEAISAGLPGLTSGDVPIWSLKVRHRPCGQRHAASSGLLQTFQFLPACMHPCGGEMARLPQTARMN